jgi:hypothetical protein
MRLTTSLISFQRRLEAVSDELHSSSFTRVAMQNQTHASTYY